MVTKGMHLRNHYPPFSVFKHYITTWEIVFLIDHLGEDSFVQWGLFVDGRKNRPKLKRSWTSLGYFLPSLGKKVKRKTTLLKRRETIIVSS